jgi:hypothetical protein
MRHWTPEQDAQLLELRSQGLQYRKISQILGRSVDALDRRHRLLIMSDAARAEMREHKNELRRVNRMHKERAAPINIPEDVWAERNARITAPRTVSASLLGDPPPGYSALDRKRQGIAV